MRTRNAILLASVILVAMSTIGSSIYFSGWRWNNSHYCCYRDTAIVTKVVQYSGGPYGAERWDVYTNDTRAVNPITLTCGYYQVNDIVQLIISTGNVNATTTIANMPSGCVNA